MISSIFVLFFIQSQITPLNAQSQCPTDAIRLVLDIDVASLSTDLIVELNLRPEQSVRYEHTDKGVRVIPNSHRPGAPTIFVQHSNCGQLVKRKGLQTVLDASDATTVRWPKTPGVSAHLVSVKNQTSGRPALNQHAKPINVQSGAPKLSIRDPKHPNIRDPTQETDRDQKHPIIRDPTQETGRDPKHPNVRDPTHRADLDPKHHDMRGPIKFNARQPIHFNVRDPTQWTGHDPAQPKIRDPSQPNVRDLTQFNVFKEDSGPAFPSISEPQVSLNIPSYESKQMPYIGSEVQHSPMQPDHILSRLTRKQNVGLPVATSRSEANVDDDNDDEFDEDHNLWVNKIRDNHEQLMKKIKKYKQKQQEQVTNVHYPNQFEADSSSILSSLSGHDKVGQVSVEADQADDQEVGQEGQEVGQEDQQVVQKGQQVSPQGQSSDESTVSESSDQPDVESAVFNAPLNLLDVITRKRQEQAEESGQQDQFQGVGGRKKWSKTDKGWDGKLQWGDQMMASYKWPGVNSKKSGPSLIKNSGQAYNGQQSNRGAAKKAYTDIASQITAGMDEVSSPAAQQQSQQGEEQNEEDKLLQAGQSQLGASINKQAELGKQVGQNRLAGVQAKGKPRVDLSKTIQEELPKNDRPEMERDQVDIGTKKNISRMDKQLIGMDRDKFGRGRVAIELGQKKELVPPKTRPKFGQKKKFWDTVADDSVFNF